MTEKNKGKIQGIISGLLVGTLLTGGILAHSSNLGTLKDVRMGGIKIVVDGKELNPTDANGKAVEPFIHNGTTYLPVRAIANAMGKAVYWDGPEYTVYLGDMDGKLEYPTVRIEDMVSISDSPSVTDALTDNYGNRYNCAISNWVTHTSLEYLLNMKYSRFKGTLYVPEGQTSGEKVHLTIEADGKVIYTSPEISKTSRPIDVDVNIKGTNDVKIYFSQDGRYKLTVCLANAGFYQ